MAPELEKQLPRPIKEVITEFPAITDILNDYDIGCGTCMVGTCLLKDVVSIHSLPTEVESKMMARIAAVLSTPGQISLPQPSGVPLRKSEITYSAPIKRLVDEHVLIKKWLALIPEIIKNMDVTSEEGKKLIVDGIDFIRSYADRYHHGKEEDILFKYFDEQSEIIQAMHSDHETGRSHVKAIGDALEKNDTATINTHLQAYRELLLEHIKKEDEILFPWMDRNLSDADKNKLATQFNRADISAGQELQTLYEHRIADLEQQIT